MKLLGQASPLVAGRLASAALTFAVPLTLARLLDPRGFGTYKQLFLVAQTALLAGQLGLSQSLYYFLPRKGAARGAFVTQTLACLTIVALVVGTALWAAGPVLGRLLGDGALGALHLPLALLACGLLVAAPLEASLTSEGRVGLSAVVYVLSDGARATLLIVSAHLDGLHGLAWGAATYAGLRVLLLFATLATRRIPLAPAEWRALREQLAYALPFAGAVWLWVAQKQFASYVVAARFDAATFARYAVASFHLPVIDILYAPIGEVLMVRIGRLHTSDREGRLREWRDAVEKLASLLWPAAACAWLFGPFLLPLLFTHRYVASVSLFMLATIEIPVWALPVDALLKASGQTRFLFGWYGLRLLLTAATVLAGLGLFGLGGAIAGSALAEWTSRLVMLRRSRAALGARIGEILVARRLLPTGVAATLATLPAWGVLHLGGGRALGIAIAAYGLSYLALRHVLRPRVLGPDALPDQVA